MPRLPKIPFVAYEIVRCISLLVRITALSTAVVYVTPPVKAFLEVTIVPLLVVLTYSRLTLMAAITEMIQTTILKTSSTYTARSKPLRDLRLSSLFQL